MLAWWEQRLGKVYLSDIDTALILGELAKASFAPATHNAYAAHLSTLFTTAIRKWGWLQSFPRIERFHVPKRRIRILHADERERLLAACKASRSPNLYAVVFLALTTGGRYREVLRLR